MIIYEQESDYYTPKKLLALCLLTYYPYVWPIVTISVEGFVTPPHQWLLSIHHTLRCCRGHDSDVSARSDASGFRQATGQIPLA